MDKRIDKPNTINLFINARKGFQFEAIFIENRKQMYSGNISKNLITVVTIIKYFRTQTIYFSLLFLLTANISFAQSMEAHYRIYSTLENKEVNLPAIAESMKRYDVVVFGEEHNDSVTHFLENRLLEDLYKHYGNKVVLSLEMFDRDVQTVMNEYLADAIRERNFTKDARVWNNYVDYRPMVEFAKTHNLDVICANAPGRYTNLAGRKGQQALAQLPKTSKQYFAPLPYATATGKYLDKLQDVMGHSTPVATDSSTQKKAGLPGGDFDFIAAQSLWDATMAWSIAEYFKKHKKSKILHINGRFHSDEKFAIITQLQGYNPNIKALVISSGTDEAFPNIDWQKHQALGDYIIITNPKVGRSF